jgi:hypothetical protein
MTTAMRYPANYGYLPRTLAAIAAGRALSGEGGTGRCRLSHVWWR